MTAQSAEIASEEYVADGKADARTRILVGAERLFRHYGYTKTTVADIAATSACRRPMSTGSFRRRRRIMSARRPHGGEIEAATWKIARLPVSASDAFALYVTETHKATVATMLDERKVYEMVSVALGGTMGASSSVISTDERHSGDDHPRRRCAGRVHQVRSRRSGQMLRRLDDFRLPPAGGGAMHGQGQRATPLELAEFALKR